MHGCWAQVWTADQRQRLRQPPTKVQLPRSRSRLAPSVPCRPLSGTSSRHAQHSMHSMLCASLLCCIEHLIPQKLSQKSGAAIAEVLAERHPVAHPRIQAAPSRVNVTGCTTMCGATF
jgi:hypothetical protein